MAVRNPGKRKDQIEISRQDTNLLHHRPGKNLLLDGKVKSGSSQGDCSAAQRVGDLGGPGIQVGGSLGRLLEGVALGTGDTLHTL